MGARRIRQHPNAELLDLGQFMKPLTAKRRKLLEKATYSKKTIIHPNIVINRLSAMYAARQNSPSHPESYYQATQHTALTQQHNKTEKI
jgi:hypothetical protein